MAIHVTTPGARVRLLVPSNAFNGIDPDPVPPGSEGAVIGTEGNFIKVSWDAGYTADHLWDDLKVIQPQHKENTR